MICWHLSTIYYHFRVVQAKWNWTLQRRPQADKVISVFDSPIAASCRCVDTSPISNPSWVIYDKINPLFKGLCVTCYEASDENIDRKWIISRFPYLCFLYTYLPSIWKLPAYLQSSIIAKCRFRSLWGRFRLRWLHCSIDYSSVDMYRLSSTVSKL